jgi:hypothetical protein
MEIGGDSQRPFTIPRTMPRKIVIATLPSAYGA